MLVLHGPVVKGCESLRLRLISHLQALLSSVGTIPGHPQAARRAEVFVALDRTGRAQATGTS